MIEATPEVQENILLEGVWVPQDHEAHREPGTSYLLTIHKRKIDFMLFEPPPYWGGGPNKHKGKEVNYLRGLSLKDPSSQQSRRYYC